ncbi:MAG TPA: choice-of-anchor Q domain-containing protein [Solirubrobacteraceae bacterium]|jgi:hypothetical protein
MRRIPAVLLPVLLLLVAASPAAATTYCVGDPEGCTGVDVDAADFEADVLQGPSDGTADTAFLNDQFFGTSDPISLEASNGDPLTVIGSDEGLSVLGSLAAGSGATVVDTQNGDPITFRNLRIAVPNNFTQGGSAIRAYRDTFEDVEVVAFNEGTDVADRFSGSVFRGGSVHTGDGPTDTFAGGFGEGTPPESFVVEDSDITAPRAIIGGNPATTATVRRSILRQYLGFEVVLAYGGRAHVENSIIFADGEEPLLAQAINDTDDALLTADHVTIIGSGNADAPVRAWTQASNDADATARVTNSIMRGFEFGYTRDAPTGAGGAATVEIAYSDFELGTPEDFGGDGDADIGPGNIDADPMFADAGDEDFHIGADSPALDAGDPAEGGLDSDFDGSPRPNDGDRDRTAVRDMGAFEFQAAPPDPLPTEEPPPGGTPPPGSPPPVVGPPLILLPDFGAATNVRVAGVALDRRGRVVLRLRNANPFAVTGRAAVSSVGPIPRAAVRLGRKSFTIAAASTKRVRVTLSKRAKKALRRRGRLAVRVAATVRSPAGTARVVRKRATLRKRR